jgi:hypothetical protein
MPIGGLSDLSNSQILDPCVVGNGMRLRIYYVVQKMTDKTFGWIKFVANLDMMIALKIINRF